jgi:putative SOS response-associated peptidase YedK
MGWGFVPRWAKGDPGKRPINARSESAAEKPLFRQAFREGRCLVPASGFFEWRKDGPVRQPYYFHRVDGAPLLFAGLQDRWEGPEGAVETFAILTTRANGLMAPIHDRMPVILDPGAGHAWMDPSPGGAQALLELLRPCPEELLACHPVDPRVGNPRVEGPDLIRPAVGPRSLFP